MFLKTTNNCNAALLFSKCEKCHTGTDMTRYSSHIHPQGLICVTEVYICWEQEYSKCLQKFNSISRSKSLCYAISMFCINLELSEPICIGEASNPSHPIQYVKVLVKGSVVCGVPNPSEGQSHQNQFLQLHQFGFMLIQCKSGGVQICALSFMLNCVGLCPGECVLIWEVKCSRTKVFLTRNNKILDAFRINSILCLQILSYLLLRVKTNSFPKYYEPMRL